MSDQPPAPEELILAMLREVLARQAKQMGLGDSQPVQPSPPPPSPSIASAQPSPPPVEESSQLTPTPAPPAPPSQPLAAVEESPPPSTFSTPLSADDFAKLARPEEPLTRAETARLAEFNALAAQPLTTFHLTPLLRPLALGLVVALILINLPLFNGLALARALPDRQALIIRDGLLLKGSGPNVYVLEANHKRWISSLDAFEHYGYVWDDVHIVEDAFLNQFPDGLPLHVLLKCNASPHIYRLENDQKRWIKDIPTFEAEGHVWEDVRFVTCEYLRRIPDGAPIPPDAGTPPQP